MIDALAALPFPHIDPVAFEVGPLAIRWYGLAYLLGFAACYGGLLLMVRRGMLRMTTNDLSDLITWSVVGVILGGRLLWYFVYHRPGPDPAPWYEPIALWKGGMSFHGGLLGVALVLLLLSRWKRLPFWNLGDCVALVVPIGLFFGRLANFINAELVGRPTLAPWGVLFPGYAEPRHPSQLYEAFLEGIVLLAALWALWKWGRPREGRIGAAFVIGYSVFRFLVEFTRMPDEEIGFLALGLTMGQYLSLLYLLAGAILWAIRGPRATDRIAARPAPGDDIPHQTGRGFDVQPGTHRPGP